MRMNKIKEHRILCLTVHSILLYDVKLMLVGIPFLYNLFIGLFLFGHCVRLLLPIFVSSSHPKSLIPPRR